MHGLLEDLGSIEGYLQSMHKKLDTAAYVASNRDGDNPVSRDTELKQSSQSEGQEPVSLHNQQANITSPHNFGNDSNFHNAPDPSLLTLPAVRFEDAERRIVGVEMAAQPSEAGNGSVVGRGDMAVADVGSRKEGIPGGEAVDQGLEEGDGGGAGGEERQGGERREGWVTCA